MLEELTIEANEESFVIVLQHGGNDVNCNPRITRSNIDFVCLFVCLFCGGIVNDLYGRCTSLLGKLCSRV